MVGCGVVAVDSQGLAAAARQTLAVLGRRSTVRPQPVSQPLGRPVLQLRLRAMCLLAAASASLTSPRRCLRIQPRAKNTSSLKFYVSDRVTFPRFVRQSVPFFTERRSTKRADGPEYQRHPRSNRKLKDLRWRWPP